MPSTLQIPPPMHREVTPARGCKTCGAWLTSRNEDDYCAEHGGWSTQMLTQRETHDARADAFAELMEVT